MANPYINLYKDNPTEGGVDGTAISYGGSFTAPLSFTLDAAKNESKVEKCAIRTEADYTASDVTIQDYNDGDNRIKVCKAEDGIFTDSITFDSIGAANSIFYVKASSADSEQPKTDRRVKLRYQGKLKRIAS